MTDRYSQQRLTYQLWYRVPCLACTCACPTSAYISIQGQRACTESTWRAALVCCVNYSADTCSQGDAVAEGRDCRTGWVTQCAILHCWASIPVGEGYWSLMSIYALEAWHLLIWTMCLLDFLFYMFAECRVSKIGVLPKRFCSEICPYL